LKAEELEDLFVFFHVTEVPEYTSVIIITVDMIPIVFSLNN